MKAYKPGQIRAMTAFTSFHERRRFEFLLYGRRGPSGIKEQRRSSLICGLELGYSCMITHRAIVKPQLNLIQLAFPSLPLAMLPSWVSKQQQRSPLADHNIPYFKHSPAHRPSIQFVRTSQHQPALAPKTWMVPCSPARVEQQPPLLSR